MEEWINKHEKHIDILKQINMHKKLDIPYLHNPVKNSKIFIKGSAGAGDQFISLKWIKELSKNNEIHYHHGKKMTRGTKDQYRILEDSHALHKLFSKLDYIKFYEDLEDIDFKQFDYWCYAPDTVYTVDLNNISDDPHLDLFENVKSNKIGLKLISGSQNGIPNANARNIDRDKFFEIIDDYKSQYEFVSLDLEEKDGFPDYIQNPPIDTDWYNTLKLISDMKLVITTCSGVAHLSAGAGINTVIILPRLHMRDNNFWLWQMRKKDEFDYTTPFYKNVRLLIQPNYKWDFLENIKNYLD